MAEARQGLYTWHVHGSNHGGINAAAITVQILVPEPAGISLLAGFLLMGAIGFRRR